MNQGDNRDNLSERAATQPVGKTAHAVAIWSDQQRSAILARAYAGERSALPELRAMLAAHPEVVQAEGNLAHDARLAMVRALAKDDIALPEVLAQRAAAIQADLEGSHPTPLERLLCERVATCWLAIYLLDAATIQTADRAHPSTQELREAELHLNRLKDSAQRRYLEACVALAKVRRLLAPIISQQVNIAAAGAQQVNQVTLIPTTPDE